MAHLNKPATRNTWTILDSYEFMASYLSHPNSAQCVRGIQFTGHRRLSTLRWNKAIQIHGREAVGNNAVIFGRINSNSVPPSGTANQRTLHYTQRRHFHNYFVTHLPSSSLHPDSRSAAGPGHRLPRASSVPHDPRSGPQPAAVTPTIGASRELTVVRIPIHSAKHHFGATTSRGSRPYNEDTYQAGTIDIPAFAKRAPMSLSRSNKAAQGKEATSANAAGGDPQVFYFGIFDGHGGRECADYLKDELHHYIERSASEFGLQSSLKRGPKSTDDPPQGVPSQAGVLPTSDHNKAGKEVLKNVDIKSEKEVLEEAKDHYPEKHDGVIEEPPTVTRVQSAAPVNQKINKAKAIELELALVQEWQETVGGYFRRFKPEFFELPEKHRRNHHRKGHHQTSVTDESGVDLSQQPPPSIETVLMYAFLRCDLDFVIAQAAKPDAAQVPDLPLNDNEVLGKPGVRPARDTIGGPTRFKGGSTASTAMISTPSATPFWHPSSPSTLLVAHVGDTRILLCETSTGLAVPVTTNHHPRSSVESARLRRYAATFVTDSFGEERMSGLANTRSFGDMGSKRIGVSAEPEVVRVELGPAQYSFIVLCSDGVAGTLTDQEVVDVVKEARTPEQAARDVVAFATEVTRDGDNATCLVVRLGGWERRGEGGLGSLGTKEIRDFRRQEATDPRRGRM